METYNLVKVWETFPYALLAISKLHLEKLVYLPSPANEPDKSIYEAARKLIAVEAALNPKEHN